MKYMSLVDCDDLVRAATAAEIIFVLSERQDYNGMDERRRRDFQIFLEAAVYMIVEGAPEFVRPANVGADVVRMCRSLRRKGPWDVH